MKVDKKYHLIALVQQHYREHGFPWSEENIIGIRGTRDYYTNKFLCRLALVSNENILVMRATTTPGPFWTPENRKRFGVTEEILCLGFYQDAYGVGNHAGHPPGFAMSQRGVLKAWRDANRNSVREETERVFDVPASAGDNIHTQKAGDKDDRVDFASAACQVAKDRELFLSEFMPRIRATQEYQKKKDAARFHYYLTQFDEFPLSSDFNEMTKGI
jgi:hypothetical protein